MINRILLVVFSIGFINSLEETKIEWSENSKLTIEDFQSKAPNTGTMQTVQGHTTIEYQFNNYELMASRNFNKDVTCYFYRSASWIDSGQDTDRLLRYAQTIFDMNEWQARELRKRFRENRSQVLAGKQSELYEQLTTEFAGIQSQYSKDTDFGRIEEKQVEWENKIKNSLVDLADYCKLCKPVRKKK